MNGYIGSVNAIKLQVDRFELGSSSNVFQFKAPFREHCQRSSSLNRLSV